LIDGTRDGVADALRRIEADARGSAGPHPIRMTLAEAPAVEPYGKDRGVADESLRRRRRAVEAIAFVDRAAAVAMGQSGS
jgi:hypothetical protein